MPHTLKFKYLTHPLLKIQRSYEDSVIHCIGQEKESTQQAPSTNFQLVGDTNVLRGKKKMKRWCPTSLHLPIDSDQWLGLLSLVLNGQLEKATVIADPFPLVLPFVGLVLRDLSKSEWKYLLALIRKK